MRGNTRFDRRPAGSVFGDLDGHIQKRGIYVALARHGYVGRLLIRPLHEADRRADGKEMLHVRGCAMQVGLHTQAYVLVFRSKPAVNLQGCVYIIRRLHIDPYDIVRGLGVSNHFLELVARGLGIDVEPELRELD